jgi:hypothetical protein
MDVTTAFLNGDVLEEIYMHAPQGYSYLGKVLKLKKALYSLKQLPRMWFRKLRHWLIQNDWNSSNYDEGVFYHKQKSLILTVYVDNINVFGKNTAIINEFKTEMGRAFKITDAGRAAWYLGLQLN